MTAPFDAKQDLADAPVTGARLRPKDAATLIVVRRGRTPAVLIGRRAHGHVFMASKWVFPGGRIDRSDFRAAFTGDFDARTAARLAHGAPPARARRFDARFFLADAEALIDPDPIAGSGELDEIAWIPLAEAEALDLPAITRFVIGEVRQRLEDPDRPAPFVRFIRGRHDIQALD